MSLSAKQTALIHVARRELDLDDETYRTLLRETAGVSTARDLDALGFRAVLDAMEALGFRRRPGKGQYGPRGGMASDAQIALIRSFWNDFTNGAGTEASLGRWMERKFKVSALRFLSAETAPKTIAALHFMTNRRNWRTPAGKEVTK